LSIAGAIYGLTEMLRRPLQEFEQAWKGDRIKTDRWFFLSELYEFKSQCTQCLEAITAALVRPFSLDPVETLLPRYKGAAARAEALRTSVVDLAHDVGVLHLGSTRCPDSELEFIRETLDQRLSAFCSHPAYGLLRPSDRYEFIGMRMALMGFRTRPQPDAL